MHCQSYQKSDSQTVHVPGPESPQCTNLSHNNSVDLALIQWLILWSYGRSMTLSWTVHSSHLGTSLELITNCPPNFIIPMDGPASIHIRSVIWAQTVRKQQPKNTVLTQSPKNVPWTVRDPCRTVYNRHIKSARDLFNFEGELVTTADSPPKDSDDL